MNAADLITPAVSAAGASAVAYIGYRQSVKVERSKMEAGAFERARKIYEASITEMEERLQRLRTDMEEILTDRRHLKSQVEQLQIVVERMRRQLKIAGIDFADDQPFTNGGGK